MNIKSLIWLGWMVCASGLTFSSVAFAGVVFQETFEPALSDWTRHGGCYPHSFAIVRDPCSKSNRVVQITNRMGEDNRVCEQPVWSRPLPGTTDVFKHRAELMPSEQETRVKPGEDFWVGMRSFIPKTYPSPSVDKPLITFHVTQIIPAFNNDGTDMSLQINEKGKWVFSIRRTPTDAPRDDVKREFGEIDRGKWTNWVFHYKRSTSDDGVVEVWKDGERVVDYQGVTSQSDEPRGLWKFGLYRGAAVKREHFGQEYIIYFDDVKIAKGPQQLEAVRPNKAASQCSAPAPQS